MNNRTQGPSWHTVAAAAVLFMTAGLFIGAQSVVRAGPDAKQLQEPLPPGVVRLSLARLHARSLTVHHNELQSRGQFLAYVYPPDVFADGVNLRAWVGTVPSEADRVKIAVELLKLVAAIAGETRLAAGVPFDARRDFRIEVHAPGWQEPWLLANRAPAVPK